MTTPLSLDGPMRAPASGGPARQAIVFLHGYGADGNDLIGLAPYFSESMPDAAFYSPHAPEPFELAPVGRQWFTLQGYDPDLMRRDPDRMADVFETMYEGAKKSAAPLSVYFNRILDELSLTHDALALIGFSQGTMMAMHLGLRRSPAVGAIVGYSGALVGEQYLAKEGKARPPILLVHGDADEVVPVRALHELQRVLDAQDIAYTAHVVPGHGHGIEQTGATLGRSFLHQNLIGG